MDKPRIRLEARQKDLMRQLSQVGPWMEGTLVSTTRFCGKDNCACRREAKFKHPVMFVTGKEDGKTVSLYIPRNREAEVRIWVKNYKKAKELMRAISDVQKQIVRLRE